MATVSPDALGAHLADSDSLVLDIRPEEEYEDWKIPDSENIDVYEELKDDPEKAKDDLGALPKDKEIVTVCAAGVISDVATETLEEMGYDAKTLEDGMGGWSRIHRSAPVDIDIDGTLIQVTRPGKGCLSYVLVSNGEAAVFDASQYSEEYETILSEYDAELVGVYDTHAHADHVSGGRTLADRHGVPYHLHPADADHINVTSIQDGETFAIGDVDITVVHTPGHSPGGVTYAIQHEAVLTGDTLFHESVGRVELGVEAGLEDTDVEDNAATLYESLQRLLDWNGNPLVLPAHDPGTPSPPLTARLTEVREQNEDLQRSRAEFIETLSSDIPDHPPNFERVKRVNVGTEDVSDDELVDIELGPNNCAAE